MVDKKNYYIITGGPGAGKSSVIEALEKRTYCVVKEAARAIIKQQKEIGGDATQSGDRAKFCQLLLEQCLNDYISHSCLDELVFFDRGLPGLLAYRTIAQGRRWNEILIKVETAVNSHRYNPKVFIFPPWEDIYTIDEERIHSYKQAKNAYDILNVAYRDAGYELIEVPKASVDKRADVILTHVINPFESD